MALVHSGGIAIATGFKVLAPQPIDDRWVVEFFSDLVNMPNPYITLEVTVLENLKKYRRLTPGWEEIKGGADISDWVAGSYDQNALVFHNNGLWRSDIDENEDEPGVANWTLKLNLTLASNGLSKVDSNIELGGNLTKDTTIDGAQNRMLYFKDIKTHIVDVVTDQNIGYDLNMFSSRATGLVNFYIYNVAHGDSDLANTRFIRLQAGENFQYEYNGKQVKRSPGSIRLDAVEGVENGASSWLQLSGTLFNLILNSNNNQKSIVAIRTGQGIVVRDEITGRGLRYNSASDYVNQDINNSAHQHDIPSIKTVKDIIEASKPIEDFAFVLDSEDTNNFIEQSLTVNTTYVFDLEIIVTKSDGFAETIKSKYIVSNNDGTLSIDHVNNQYINNEDNDDVVIDLVSNIAGSLFLLDLVNQTTDILRVFVNLKVKTLAFAPTSEI